jgi:excisionase family DNA binding protein
MSAQKVKDDQDVAEPSLGPIVGAKWKDRSTFSIPEVAEILGVSGWALYQAAGKGELPVITVGRRKVVPRRALEKLLGA